MSPYKWGLTVPGYSGRFMVDPRTGDAYCLGCWFNMHDLYDEQLSEVSTVDGDNELGPLGGYQMDGIHRRTESSDEEADYPGGS